MAAKRSETERQARILMAYQSLCDGAPYSLVAETIAKQFKVTTRTAETDIANATELIKNDFQNDRNFLRNAALEKRYRLLMQAEKDGDIKLALAILDSTAKIQGLFHMDANVALSMLRDEYGLVVIDPKLDNVQLLDQMYNEALEQRDRDNGGYTPKSAQEREDDLSESCGYRRSHGTRPRPDPETSDVDQ